MSGTIEGGKRAASTNRRRHGDDFYKKIGSISGSKSRPDRRPFHMNRELARMAGRKGAQARIATLKRRAEEQNGKQQP